MSTGSAPPSLPPITPPPLGWEAEGGEPGAGVRGEVVGVTAATQGGVDGEVVDMLMVLLVVVLPPLW